jgi:hypothetical protein
MSARPLSDFEKAALSQDRDSILREFWKFLQYNTKWCLRYSYGSGC